MLRDPFPDARELERRGVAEPMRAVEQRLVEALANDALDEITVGRGAARRFRADLLDDFGGETLGGGLLTVAHLEASDPSFRYETVARRVARVRWVRLAAALARYLDPGDGASVQARMAAREPSERWLPRMVERGVVDATDLRDPWGGQFQLVRVARPAFVLSHHAPDLELVSPGPDGRPGTADDVRDPFARVVPAGTPWSVASGEDELLRQLALLSPYERTLAALTEAFHRISAEMTEELIGDAVHGGISEGALGLSGFGVSGSGSGYGYGGGSGGFGSRSASAPSIRTGSAETHGLGGLARVLRQRFPATLLFVPSVELDARGRAVVEVPLADAVTTYLVEAVLWRTDGWSWSASTRIEVDREVVVDAPIPDVARLDDAIELPVRVSNRGTRSRTLVVSVLDAPELGIVASAPRTVEVGPGGSAVASMVVRAGREGRGAVRVVVATPDGVALDAIQLPLEVVARARRRRRRATLLAVRQGALAIEVPADAVARQAELEVRVGEGLILPPVEPTLQAWASALGDPHPPDPLDRTAADTPLRLAARWGSSTLSEGMASRALNVISSDVDQRMRGATSPSERLGHVARMLLDLAPLLQALERRPRLQDRARELAARLRGAVAEDATQLSDDPGALVLAAAALAWSTPADEPATLAAELLRRVERSVVSLGADVFVASEGDPLGASTLLALADARLGRGDRALAVISTIARWTDDGRMLPDPLRAWARVATSAVGQSQGRARVVTLTIDDRSRTLEAEGVLRVDAPELAQPGAHRVEIALDGTALVAARATALFGAPWPSEPVRGPFALALEGEIGALDDTAELELVVRNVTPRTLVTPIVEVDLPTGAELTAESRAAITARCARPPDRSGDVLTLTLAPMLPGAVRRIPLPLRWSVGGTLLGLGVAAYDREREERASVLPPRAISIFQRAARVGGER
ncbi:MAG: hypothetical protein OHK0013_46420 [Sandaracinaceae bacterium]